LVGIVVQTRGGTSLDDVIIASRQTMIRSNFLFFPSFERVLLSPVHHHTLSCNIPWRGRGKHTFCRLGVTPTHHTHRSIYDPKNSAIVHLPIPPLQYNPSSHP